MITNQMIEGIVGFAGSGFIGYIMGFAVRKIIKWLIIISGVILGTFFMGVYYLQAKGYLTGTVNWEKMGNDLGNATQGYIQNAQSGQYNGALHQVIQNLGIPVSSGLAVGFTIGFLKTH